MCDYCGCRSEPPIAELGQEHAEILWHISQLEAVIHKRDIVESKRLFQHLLEHLRPHVEKENSGLFAQLRAEGELIEEVDTLEGEHHGIWTFVAELPDGHDEWFAACTSFIATMQEHIHIEEYDLFPAAFQTLSNTGWIAVRAVHEHPHTDGVGD
jgi:hemerythrin-like domain-containing protein